MKTNYVTYGNFAIIGKNADKAADELAELDRGVGTRIMAAPSYYGSEMLDAETQNRKYIADKYYVAIVHATTFFA